MINDVNGKENARGYVAWSSPPYPFAPDTRKEGVEKILCLTFP